MFNPTKHSFLKAGEELEDSTFTTRVSGLSEVCKLAFSGLWGLLFWLTFFLVAIDAQGVPPAETVKSVAQLQKLLVDQEQRLTCSLALTGTVCDASAAQQVIAFADNTGAEILWLSFSGQALKAGTRVTLISTNCEIIRRPVGLAVYQAALVENDGAHEVLEKSATVRLPAGNCPIRLEWFNLAGNGALSLEFSGPEILRESIPDSYLSHSNPDLATAKKDVNRALTLNTYRGSWPKLPDFSQLLLSEASVTTNFKLGRWAGMTNVGLQFSGLIQVPHAGDYTFYLKSCDGSRLYLGTPEPTINVFDEGLVPYPSQFFIGMVLPASTSQWAAVEGVVHFATTHGGHMELELRSPSNNRMQVDVLDDTGVSPELLMNSKLRVTGVGRSAFSVGGQRIFGQLTAIDRKSIQIIDIAPRLWAAHPLLTPEEVAAIMKAGGGVVHLAGDLCSGETNSPLVLKDGSINIFVDPTTEASLLAGKKVEAIGLCSQIGTNWYLTSSYLRRLRAVEAGGTMEELPLLTTVDQVARIYHGESTLNYPVNLRGVVTCVWPNDFRKFLLQDSTRGVFVQLADDSGLNEVQPGDFLEIHGYTTNGTFSPSVRAYDGKRRGEGRFPEPVHPSWDQLVNGSLDCQYVEIEGIIAEIQKQSLTLLTHWGKISISITDQDPAVFEKYENKLVRLRGCLQAIWDDKTHQVNAGCISIQNAVVNVDEVLPADPFSIPAKTIEQMLQFDVRAAAFNRVHVFGNIVSRRGREFFLMNNNLGLRFIADQGEQIKPGDRVDVVGYPELGGPSPILRESLVRKSGEGSMPVPQKIRREDLASPGHDATRVQIVATLLNLRTDRSKVGLEMQAGLQPFLASYQGKLADLPSLRAGSRLELTGVYVSLGNGSAIERGLDSFELLLDSPAAIKILSQPPWWTLKRLALAVGALSLLLSLVALWVFQLRRQVATQTKIIHAKAQREATLEERTRIARELHDTLEQALAGISLQLRAFADSFRDMPEELARILNMARHMVRHGQDEARRTVRNLRTLALENGGLPGALSTMACETGNGLAVKIEVKLIGTPRPIEGKVESHLLRVGQEAMTNAIKHANAKSIGITLHYEPSAVRLEVCDNGCGFDVLRAAPSEAGHFGLLGMRERVEKIHGTLNVMSRPGSGTVVVVTVPLPEPVSNK